MTKKEARKWFMNLRETIHPIDLSNKNEQLLRQLQLHFDWKNQCIATFLTMQNKLELDTAPLNDWLMQENQLCAPVSNFNRIEMDFFPLDNETEIHINTYGIPEPKETHCIDPQNIDIVLTPLLGFDQSGYRVGYGKGFYDRFSTRTSPSTIYVGLSLFEAIPELEDVHSQDKKLDFCVTPNSFYTF